MFEDIFGFKSKSFIAPNYIWNSEIEIILNENGVKYLQGSFFQYTQINGVKYNYLGKTNELGQIYLTRNVIFEPSSNRKIDWINNALSEIETAFNLKKPAVITMHRVSFVGGIFEENRILNLKMFDELLKQIIKKWPNVEFMHSAELGSIINKN
jgi:hypothetical protein